MLFISDAISGDVIYTLRTRRRRWSLMSWMSCFRSFFDFHNNHNDDSEGNNPASTEEEIAVWKGPSTSGRPHLVLSGSLHDMNFDILTTTTTSSNTQQRQEIRGRRRGGGGSVVGVVSKYLFDMRETLHDNGRYGVHVQAGYDSALFVLLAIIVDELYHHHHHHPGSAPASTYDNVVGRKAGRGEEHSVVMESTTTTERSDSMVSAEEESLPMALALDHIMSLSVGESFSDNEDRLRGEAGKLQEHLTDTSNSSL